VIIPRDRRRASHHHDPSGQGLVEVALVAPVLLLLLLVGIDFGRVFLGWVNVQQMARVAADYAADHATAWNTPGDATVKARFQTIVRNDARNINCTLPTPLPEPAFPTGTAIGQTVVVHVDCQFSLITPVISQVLGPTIVTSASATYPIKQGIVATVPGGGAPPVAPPVVDFVASPRSGWSPLVVTMTDTTQNSPTSWNWDFNTGMTTTGTGVAAAPSPATSLAKGPHTVTYTCNGNPGDTCSYGVSLAVGNAGGTASVNRPAYVTVTVPPPTGPIADFTGTPRSGTQPLNVAFAFNDLRNNGVTYTQYQWDFTNDGTFDATGVSASHVYSSPGLYDVRLRVTDNASNTSEIVKVGYIFVGKRVCTVPDFAQQKRNDAQTIWSAAGFTTTVTFAANSPNGNFTIHSQTILGGTVDPQPDGCNSQITVGP
jgi:PKD repeat protein